MADLDAADAVMTQDTSAIFLEIDDPAGGAPTRLPVILKNLSGEIATLELVEFYLLKGWQDLEGRHAALCLLEPEHRAPVHIQGAVAWKGFTGEGRPRLALGLELAQPTPAIRKLLEKFAVHTPKDIKGLWERWDEVRETAPPPLVDRKLYFAGLGLLLAGLALQLPDPRGLKLLGWGLWLLGSLGLAGKSICALWRQRNFPLR